MAAILRSSFFFAGREHVNSRGTQQKKQPISILQLTCRSPTPEVPQSMLPLFAPLPGGISSMIFWSVHLSLGKCRAGGLDETASPVVTSVPIHWTGTIGGTL